MLGRWFGKGDKLAEGGEGEYIGLSKHNVSLCDTMDAYFDEEQSAKLDEIEKELGLEKDDKKFMIGICSRLTDQKGLDLVDYVIEEICSEDTQLVIIGTGEGKYEHLFRHYAWKYPDRVSANIYYCDEKNKKICVHLCNLW